MSYTITGLDPKQFEQLRNATDEELAALHIQRMTVDGPRFPDRVTLKDMPLGARVLLLNYEHQRGDAARCRGRRRQSRRARYRAPLQ